MSMNESQITSIEASIKALMATGNPLMPGLRNLFPNITFVRCSARDMEATPYRISNKFQLYLLDRSEVCIRLTDRLESADGVIVAELESDD
ncbi:MAG TPA: hypothetical protein VKG67_05945 [Gallionellaceae bacterium]|nr:hypothetical protein [Gallionellaceae bacterium]